MKKYANDVEKWNIVLQNSTISADRKAVNDKK
jgi:hypothetical protein